MRPPANRIASYLHGIYQEHAGRFVRRVVERKHVPGLTDELLRRLVAENPGGAAARLSEIDEAWANRQVCFGQEGEDLVLSRLFSRRESGFFVDVGAFDPIRFSNTFLFYRRGWRGINIDATPGCMAAFDRVRPNDVNIECFVSDHPGAVDFHLFDEGALNTSSGDLAAQRLVEAPQHRPAGTVRVARRRLSDILEEHLPDGTPFDFLDIDVEGAEMDVLRSNDWQRYRPRIILVEQLETTIESMSENETTKFLKDAGYSPIYKTFNTAFFEDNAEA